jgi:predicted metalloenzyme YecM
MIANIRQYQTENLFLLMGGNPLPSYIAAISLLNPKGKALLLHTSQTQLQAQRLQNVLSKYQSFSTALLIDIGKLQADSYAIYQAVKQVANSLKTSVGLNYTGGTKAMSVHAYRAITDIHPNAVCSYLDANTLEMYFDSNEQNSDRLKVLPKLSLAELFELHGLIWRSHPIDSPVLPDLATQFANYFQSFETAREWRVWCNQELNPKTKEYGQQFWLEERELLNLAPLSLQKLSRGWRKLLESIGAVQNRLSLKTSSTYGFNSCTSLCEWLDGIWLEHYVLDQVKKIAAKLDIQECKMSFRIDEQSSKNRRWEKFEFDVAFVRNYQLFAISCTTSGDRKTCKQKLFEAHARAKLLGGSEARVGLVCCNNHPDTLREELEVQKRDQRVAVFGRQDLSNLGQKILNWVKQND